MKQSPNEGLIVEATTLPFWSWRKQPVSPFPVDDAYTGFSRRLRAQDSLPFCILLADRGLCQRASHPKECRSLTQAAQSSCHCLNTALNEQHFLPLEGAQSLTGCIPPFRLFKELVTLMTKSDQIEVTFHVDNIVRIDMLVKDGIVHATSGCVFKLNLLAM